MCEITRHNFEEKLASILTHIDQSAFIAIDTEFTGLRSNPEDKHSLFNGADESYQLLRKNASQFIINEIGVAAFVANPKQNTYEVFSYNFYIFPSSDGLQDSCFSMQASSTEFLAEHKFDFNKWLYDGVTYMNLEKEKQLEQRLKNLDFSCKADENLNGDLLQQTISDVSRWLETAHFGATMEVSTDRILHSLFFHLALRQLFPKVWTRKGKGKIVVEKVNDETRKEKEKLDSTMNEEIMQAKLGFCKVFKHLQKAKKAIIGHNLMLDLLLMYNQFHKPLPKKLKDFKRTLLELFPKIYDTKHLAYEMRKQIRDKNVSVLFNLFDLYGEISKPQSPLVLLYVPCIKLAEGFKKYESEHQHEAGYDAFLTGSVFIRLAHFYANCKFNTVLAIRQLSPAQHLNAVQGFRNRINLIRGRINFIDLENDDPVSHRPDWLVISSKKKKIDLVNVTNFMSSFGSFDYRLLNDYTMLVATSNIRCFNDILRGFRKEKLYSQHHVTKYNVLFHSPYFRTSLWIAACGLGGLGILFLIRAVKN